MRHVLILITAMIVSTFASTARASTFLWESNGAGCVPDSSAIDGNKYFITGGTVAFKSGVTGTVTLYCPVSPRLFNYNGLNADVMSLTYGLKNSSGTASMTATLIKMGITNGSVTNVETLTETSSTGGGTGTGTEAVSSTFSVTFDFTSYYYYVRVDMVLGGTSDTANFYGVALDH